MPSSALRRSLFAVVVALVPACGQPPAPLVDAPLPDPTCVASVTLSLEESRAYFPLAAGDRRVLEGERGDASAGGTVIDYQSDSSVSDDGTTLLVTEVNVEATNQMASRRLRADDSGVVAVDGAPRVGTPYHEIQFPLRICSSFVAYDVPPGSGDVDADGDGTPDPRHSRAVVAVRAIEPVDTPLGTFADALRVERTLTQTTRYDGAATAVVGTTNVVEWYAKGIGLVRRTFDAAPDEAEAQPRNPPVGHFDEQLLGVSADGAARGVLPNGVVVAGLGPADTDADNPGRPGVAFDGSRFLVLTYRSDAASVVGTLYGTFVSKSGAVEETITVASNVVVQPDRADVVFDGQSYFVICEPANDVGNSEGVYGLRVSPSGAVGSPTLLAADGGDATLALGAAGILVAFVRYSQTKIDLASVIVSPSGAVSAEQLLAARAGAHPSAASDGTNFLVVWQSQLLEDGELWAARVSASGQTLDPNGFAVATGPALASDPRVGFDGAHYLAAWYHTRQPSSVGDGEIHAARIATDGTLLDGPSDAGGFIVSADQGHTGHPWIAPFGGSSLVVWEGDGAIWGARITADGTRLDHRLWMSSQPGTPGNGAGDYTYPVVGPAPDRALLVFLDLDLVVNGTKAFVSSLLLPW